MASHIGNVSRDDEILYSLPALQSLSRDQLGDICAWYRISRNGKKEDLVDRLVEHGRTILSSIDMQPNSPTTPQSHFSIQDHLRPHDNNRPTSSPPEKMTLSRSTARPPLLPSISTRSSFYHLSLPTRGNRRNSQLMDSNREAYEGDMSGKGGDETWEIIGEGDTSTQTIQQSHSANRPSMSTQFFDRFGRKRKYLPEDEGDNDGEFNVHGGKGPKVKESQSWNGRGLSARGWKSARNGGNGFEGGGGGTDEFGVKEKNVERTHSLGRKSFNSLRTMASHLSLRRAASSNGLGLNRRASTNMLGRQPPARPLATELYKDTQARESIQQQSIVQPSSIRNKAIFRSAFEKPEVPLGDTEMEDPMEEIANPPSPAPTETVGIAKRHRGSVMGGPSTIRLISSGPTMPGMMLNALDDAGRDEAFGSRARGGIGSGETASIPMMFGVGTGRAGSTDSPDVPKLLPLRLSTFPMDESMSIKSKSSRRSSIASDNESDVFQVGKDAPPFPSLGGSILEDQDGEVTPTKSTFMPEAFPARPTFLFGSPAHRLSNKEFNDSAEDLFRNLGKQSIGGGSASGMVQHGGDDVEDKKGVGKVESEGLRKMIAEYEERLKKERLASQGGVKADRYEAAHKKQFNKMNPIGNRVVSDIAKPLPRLPSEADLRSAAAAKGAGIKRKASGAAASAGRHVEMGQAKRTRGDDGKRIHGGVRVVIGQPSTIADIEGGAAKQGILDTVKDSLSTLARRLSGGPDSILTNAGSSANMAFNIPGDFQETTSSVINGQDIAVQRPRNSKAQPTGLPRPAKDHTRAPSSNKLKKASSNVGVGHGTTQAQAQAPISGALRIARQGDGNLPLAPPTQRRLISKGSTSSKLSEQHHEFKTSSRAVPMLPGLIEAEERRKAASRMAPKTSNLMVPKPMMKVRVASGGGAAGLKRETSMEVAVDEMKDRRMKEMPRNTDESIIGERAGLSSSQNGPIDRAGPPYRSLLTGPSTIKPKQPPHHLARDSHPHKQASPSRKRIEATRGVKSGPSRAALELAKKQRELREQRRRGEEERKLNAELLGR